jgi:hypothetical protein
MFVTGPLVTDIDTDVVILRDLPFEVVAYFLIGSALEHFYFLSINFNIFITIRSLKRTVHHESSKTRKKIGIRYS